MLPLVTLSVHLCHRLTLLWLSNLLIPDITLHTQETDQDSSQRPVKVVF